MASYTMMGKIAASRPFSAASASARPRQQPRTAIRCSKDAENSQTSQTVGTLVAAQLAFLPAAGPALAKGKLAVEGALDAGEAVQSSVPKGAINPKVREERNSSRDAGIDDKLSTLKKRFSPDAIMNSPDSGGRQNIFAPGSSQKGVSYESTPSTAPSLLFAVDFNPTEKAGLQHSVGNPIATKDLARRQPKDDPLAPAEGKLPIQPEEITGAAENAAGKAADAAKDAAPNGSGVLESLGSKIKGAAITGDSPRAQLQQGADKAKGAVQDLKRQPNVLFTPAAQGSSLLHYVSDMGNASFQEPLGNEGGITQPTERTDLDLPGNPKRGGDLKDSPTDFAAQFKGGRDEGTPAQTGATPRGGANTPKGVGEIRNPSTPTLPNALGGKDFLRDDSETPEATASGNIAKAQASSGNAFDSIKKGLGL